MDELLARAIADGHPEGQPGVPAGLMDALYDIRAAEPDGPLYAERRAIAGALVASRYESRLDVAYGPTEAERLDIFLPRRVARLRPVQVIFHGGYWRGGDKEDVRMLAGPLCEAGCVAVLVNYGLCPGVSFDELVAQCARAVRWVQAHIGGYGADASLLHVTGHSAGAHLAVLLAVQVAGVFKSISSVSGIYDLAPVAHCFLQPLLKLSAAQIAAYSPLYLPPPDAPAILLAAGADETPAFGWHLRRYARHLQAHPNVRCLDVRCLDVRCLDVPGSTHNGILEELCAPGTELNRHWLEVTGLD